MADGPPLLPGGSSCHQEAPSSPSLRCGVASLQPSSVTVCITPPPAPSPPALTWKNPQVSEIVALSCVCFEAINLMDSITHWRLWTESPGLIMGRCCLLECFFLLSLI